MDILSRDTWARAFAAYYGALARNPHGESARIQRGRDLFDTWSHRHPMTVAAAEHRSDAIGRQAGQDLLSR